MNQREAADLDRYITGSWGEDQIEPDDDDPRIAVAERVAKALAGLRAACLAADSALAAWNALK